MMLRLDALPSAQGAIPPCVACRYAIDAAIFGRKMLSRRIEIFDISIALAYREEKDDTA